jgi:hypothetical protein
MTVHRPSQSTISLLQLGAIGVSALLGIIALAVASRPRRAPLAAQPTSPAHPSSFSPPPALRSKTIHTTRSNIMIRFTSWLAVGIAGAFLVVATTSFSAATTVSLAFAIGIATLVVSAGVGYRYRKDLASLALASVTVVVSVWTIVSSLVFLQTTVQSLALASALALSGLAILGLTTHEIENDYGMPSHQHEDTSRDSDSRLATAA